jgi:hypothetical protein
MKVPHKNPQKWLKRGVADDFDGDSKFDNARKLPTAAKVTFLVTSLCTISFFLPILNPLILRQDFITFLGSGGHLVFSDA